MARDGIRADAWLMHERHFTGSAAFVPERGGCVGALQHRMQGLGAGALRSLQRACGARAGTLREPANGSTTERVLHCGITLD